MSAEASVVEGLQVWADELAEIISQGDAAQNDGAVRNVSMSLVRAMDLVNVLRAASTRLTNVAPAPRRI